MNELLDMFLYFAITVGLAAACMIAAGVLLGIAIFVRTMWENEL